MLDNKHTSMLNESENYLLKLASDFNLKKISKFEYDKKRIDWEDELFCTHFMLWKYDLDKAFKKYNEAKISYLENYRMGNINLLNSGTSEWELKEKIDKAAIEAAKKAYKVLVNRAKNIPVHSILKDSIPIPPIDFDNDL